MYVIIVLLHLLISIHNMYYIITIAIKQLRVDLYYNGETNKYYLHRQYTIFNMPKIY